MASLPDDILYEVLLLLPAKPMARFRCVCKSWRNLLTDPDFLNIYNNTHKQILIASFFGPLRCQSMICYNSPVVIENLKIPTQLFSSRIPTVHFFSSCNGLVLSAFNGDLFLWNPTTRDCMKLPSIQQQQQQEDSSPFYGIGYVSSTDDFKVVRGDQTRVRIYSRISNSWKIIGRFPTKVENIWKIMGTGFNGFLHWIVFTSNMEGRVCKGIVSLDLEREEYKVLPLPHDDNNYILIYLGVLEGFLCVVYDYYGQGPKVWSIWVMEEYGVKESWFKMLEIPRLEISNLVIPLCVTGGEIVMQVGYDKIVKYDRVSEEFKTLVKSSSQFSIESIVYGESFTAPKRFMQGNKNKGADIRLSS